MAPLPGFSDNALKDRKDVERAALALLQSLCKYQSTGGARIRIPVSTGTHFDETAAQVEGFARPLWAIGALLAGSDRSNKAIRDLTKPFIQGLANGTDPDHPEYWGPVVVCDQRMVEMEIISYALLAAPDAFFHDRTPDIQTNIISWLMTINGKDMPAMNWRWFRVLTNLALIKTCGVSADQLRTAIDEDLNLLDTFYIANGWSSDGLWSDKGRQADYYSGSFAIQFSQLMYVKFAKDIDPKRCESYRDRACLFSKGFYHYFDQKGAAIPFGRSLTYRFAFAGFWAAAAYVGVELPPPMNESGMVKGLLLRHLRWWTLKPDIFDTDGTLNIGFTFPNMYMCEDYNSPQSVYWCMKSFCCLGLPDEHPFWIEKESSLPSDSISLTNVVEQPMQIVCNTGSHHFLLSSGQFCPWPLKATEAKYGKFAYSSHFGFSVPTGPLIQQMAPDSTIALKISNDDSWKVRWIPTETKLSTAVLVAHAKHEPIPMLVSSWKPWKLFNIDVSTALIAPSSRWPHWHIRVHKILIRSEVCIGIDAVEGGFAIYGRQSSDGLPIPPRALTGLTGPEDFKRPIEATSTDSEGCVVCSVDGASGIRKLEPHFGDPQFGSLICQTTGSLLKPDSNTNLMRQRTVIPTLQSIIPPSDGSEPRTYYLASAIFALDTNKPELIKLWNDVPVLHLGMAEDKKDNIYIRIEEW